MKVSTFKIQKLQKLKNSIENIPKEWNIYKGEEIFVLSSGVSPIEVNFENTEKGDILYIKVDDMNLPINSKWIKDSKEKFEYKLNLKIPVADTKSIIFPKRGAAILTNKVRILEKRCTVDPNIMVLSCKPLLFPDFMYYHLLNFKLFNIMENAGLPQLNNKDLYPRNFVIPPLKEQQKIASILSNVDELIQKTEQIIEQTQRLKKGLMQRLLTKGIGHNKFKKTELGEIPEEWQIVKVTDICQGIVPGRNKPTQFNGNIPWITIEDINGMYIKDSKKGLRITKEEVKRSAGKIIPSNSVIMTCVGELGITAIALNDIVINQQLHAFVCSDKIIPYYLATFLILQKKYMYSIATTTTIPYMNKDNCNSIPIILPSIKEQHKITKILKDLELFYQHQQSKRYSLINLKKGLMQQLLTGKIRVKV